MQTDHAADIAAILAHPAYRAAVAALDADHDRIVQEIITLTEIPSPPFKEEPRAAAWRRRLDRPRGADPVLALRWSQPSGVVVRRRQADRFRFDIPRRQKRSVENNPEREEWLPICRPIAST